MKHAIIALFLSWAIVGCEQPGTNAAATDPATNPNPSMNATPPTDVSQLIGTWNPVLVNGQQQWCTKGDDGLWTCASNWGGGPVDACEAPGVWPIIGGYSVLGSGIMFDGTTVQFPELQTVSYDNATGMVTLSPSGYSWGVAEFQGQAILSYGPGCSLLMAK